MSERLTCPASPDHRPRMISDDRLGFSIGRLIPWCYACGCELPPVASLAIVPLSADALQTMMQEQRTEQTRKARQAAAERAKAQGEWSRQPTPDQRRRDAEIRLAWGNGTHPTVLATLHGLSETRVYQILQGRKRSA